MKSVCTILAVCISIAAIPSQSDAAQTAAYLFDESSGDSAADFIRGAAGNGTLVNFTGAQWVPGKIGNAIELNGINNYVLALNAIPTGTTQFSISGWVWADSAPTWASIVKNWGNTGTGSFHFGLDAATGRLSNYLASPQDGPIISPSTLSLNTWHHVAVTWDAALHEEILYIDGSSVATRSTGAGLNSLTALTPNMSFGVKTVTSTLAADTAVPGYWDGKFDDFVFFDNVLTPAQVAQIKTNGDNGISAVVPEPGSIALLAAGVAGLFIRRRRP